jgi:hypothetical protein
MGQKVSETHQLLAGDNAVNRLVDNIDAINRNSET